SDLMLAARITLPHFSASSAMNVPNAADVIDIGSTPKPASRALMTGSAVTALISWLSLSITSAGVSFGAPIPYHWLASWPGRNSARVEISGSTSERGQRRHRQRAQHAAPDVLDARGDGAENDLHLSAEQIGNVTAAIRNVDQGNAGHH